MSSYGKSTFQNGYGYYEERVDHEDQGIKDLYAELGRHGMKTSRGSDKDITDEYLESMAEELDDLDVSPEQIGSEASRVQRPPRPGVENLITEIEDALEAFNQRHVEEMNDEAKDWYGKARVTYQSLESFPES